MMLSRIDDLEVFLKVVEQNGFTNAAHALDLPVAKVSRSIQRLEARLQIRLFHRTTRRVVLTDEGDAFSFEVRKILNDLEHAETQLQRQSKAIRGRIRVDAASPFMINQITPYVLEFKQKFPDINLELITTENNIDLLEHRTDVAFRIGALEDSSMHRRPLGNSKLKIVATPEYLKHHGVPNCFNALSNHICLGFSEPTKLNYWPISSQKPQENLNSQLIEKEKRCQERGHEWSRVPPDIVANSGEVLKKLCLNHNGIGCLSNFMVDDEIKKGKLVVLFENECMLPNAREMIYAIFYKSGKLPQRIEVFLDFFSKKIRL